MPPRDANPTPSFGGFGLSLLRRHQELGLPEALLRVSYSEHPPLPRPGAAPTTFYYIIPTLPQAGEGFLRTNQDSLDGTTLAQKIDKAPEVFYRV